MLSMCSFRTNCIEKLIKIANLISHHYSPEELYLQGHVKDDSVRGISLK